MFLYVIWEKTLKDDKIGAKLEAGNEEFISHNLDYRPVCGIKILRG
nr:MAG TPA: hypothetical protein [Caudoviricetes sp.]